MENYRDIESLLTPSVEAKASDSLRVRIADIKPQKHRNRRWVAAASIAITFCLGMAAATIYHFAPKATSEAPSSEVAATETPAPKPDFFVFDNVEMEQVAATLAKHYRLKPVFQNEEAKHLRLYFQVEKSKSIEEVVELLNHFSKVSVTIKEEQLIIK